MDWLYEMMAKQDRERMEYNSWDSIDIIQRDVSGDIHLFCHFAGNSGASKQVSK